MLGSRSAVPAAAPRGSITWSTGMGCRCHRCRTRPIRRHSIPGPSLRSAPRDRHVGRRRFSRTQFAATRPTPPVRSSLSCADRGIRAVIAEPADQMEHPRGRGSRGDRPIGDNPGLSISAMSSNAASATSSNDVASPPRYDKQPPQLSRWTMWRRRSSASNSRDSVDARIAARSAAVRVR
jgi:hypothetical protein